MQTKPVIKSSAFLFSFYAAYAAWLDDGAESKDFLRNVALCANLFDYCVSRGEPTECHLEDMHQQFAVAGLNAILPFNLSWLHYYCEGREFSCHSNKRRIAWVRDRIKDGEITDANSQQNQEAAL